MPLPVISFVGFFVLAGIAWLCSEQRKNVNWKAVCWGCGLQLMIGAVVFRAPVARRAFLWLNDAVMALLRASGRGTSFVFGPLAAGPGESGSVGFVLAFQVLPVVIFFSAFTAVLYHFGILQPVVRLFAKLFRWLMGISGAEALCGSANIFVGVESALVVRPYLAGMTRSELMMVLSAGMATVASSTLGMYVSFLGKVFPQIAGHLISASVISIPAAVVMAKLMVPETAYPATMGTVPPEDASLKSRSAMSAVIEGSWDGVRLAVGIGALLIALLGLLAVADGFLSFVAGKLGAGGRFSFVTLLGWLFIPLTALLGIAPADVLTASRLLGERVILTEVVPYQELADLAAAGGFSDPRTVVVLSYALCGFAHIASVAIFVGGTAALVPSRRNELALLGGRALVAATLATLMTGCVAGIFSRGEAMLLLPG